jgi:hypothetical protein
MVYQSIFSRSVQNSGNNYAVYGGAGRGEGDPRAFSSYDKLFPLFNEGK